MRRSVPLLLTCLLCLTTGIALLGASAIVAMPTRELGSFGAPDPVAEANAALVRRFYDAINTSVATGDPTPLVAFVAPDFADRAPPAGIAPTGGGFMKHVVGLGRIFPTMHLQVEDLEAHGDLVLARVRVDGLAQGVFLGATISGEPAAWAGLDLYRIADGRIAERWTADGLPILPRALAQTPLARPPAVAFTRLVRVTYAPGAVQPWFATLGSLFVAAERGTLTVRVGGEAALTHAGEADTGTSPSAIASPTGDLLLGPGDALLLPSGARFSARNTGDEPVSVLTLALHPWSPGAPEGSQFIWPDASLPDVEAQVLFEDVATDLPEGPATIALGRVALAPRSTLTTAGATGPWLAVVEAGALQIETPTAHGTTLRAGQGTLVPAASAPTFRNMGDGQLVVLLVTIMPDTQALTLNG